MKLRLILLLLPLLVLFACNRSEKSEYNDDGTLKKKTLYTSPDKSNYREIEYSDGNTITGLREYTDGIRNGRYFDYYSNGKIKSVFYYDMGRLNSIARFYDSGGNLTDKGLFIQDSMVVKEEFFYRDNMMKMNAFSKNTGQFDQAGELLYNKEGLFAVSNSFYYIVRSADSIPTGDSLRVFVDFISPENQNSHIALSLGSLDEQLQFTSKDKTYMSDSLSLSFYFKPRKTGYNLILGKLLYITDKPKEQVKEFVFYHDFLTY